MSEIENQDQNESLILEESETSLNEQGTDNETSSDSNSIDENIGNWYIIQTLSNYEQRVQTRVQNLIDENKFSSTLFRVLVPMQQTVELKNNKRLEKNTKIFPGYVFIQMNIDETLAYEIRQFPDALLKGPSMFCQAKAGVEGLAKLLVEFSKQNQVFRLKGGFLDNHYMDPDQINTLAKLPSKEVLTAKAVGYIKAPVAGLVLFFIMHSI